MVTLAVSGLSKVMQTIPVGSFDPSVVLRKRSTFVAPWRRRASSRSSSLSEKGRPWMIPFFPQEDFGRLVVRGLLAALVIFRKAFLCVVGFEDEEVSDPRSVGVFWSSSLVSIVLNHCF